MHCYVKRVEKLSPNCERVKKLTKSIYEMIARDIRPISIVDDVGFLNLMKEAEPRYTVPCRSIISWYIDDMYVQEKRVARSMLADVDYLCCTALVTCGPHEVLMAIFLWDVTLSIQISKCAINICKHNFQ